MSDEMEKEWNEFVNGNRELICGFEDALVMAFNAGWFAGKQEAVRLASENVGLKALKKYCEQNELRIERQELEENSYPIVIHSILFPFENRRLALLGDGDFVINKKSLIDWAEKEAKK